MGSNGDRRSDVRSDGKSRDGKVRRDMFAGYAAGLFGRMGKLHVR